MLWFGSVVFVVGVHSLCVYSSMYGWVLLYFVGGVVCVLGFFSVVSCWGYILSLLNKSYS